MTGVMIIQGRELKRRGYRTDPRALGWTSGLGQNPTEARASLPLGLAQRRGPHQGYGRAHAALEAGAPV